MSACGARQGRYLCPGQKGQCFCPCSSTNSDHHGLVLLVESRCCVDYVGHSPPYRERGGQGCGSPPSKAPLSWEISETAFVPLPSTILAMTRLDWINVVVTVYIALPGPVDLALRSLFSPYTTLEPLHCRRRYFRRQCSMKPLGIMTGTGCPSLAARLGSHRTGHHADGYRTI